MALSRELAARWEETRESWTDAKRDEFERRFLADLFAGVDHAASALEQLEAVVAKARSDCE